jgi:hypothetical protein
LAREAAGPGRDIIVRIIAKVSQDCAPCLDAWLAFLLSKATWFQDLWSYRNAVIGKGWARNFRPDMELPVFYYKGRDVMLSEDAHSGKRREFVLFGRGSRLRASLDYRQGDK